MIDAAASPDTVAAPADAPLHVVRVPILDREQQLLAYELLPQPDQGAQPEAQTHRLLASVIDGSIQQLTRGSPVFLRLPRQALLEQAGFVLRQPRTGLVMVPADAGDPALLRRLEQLAQRGCTLLLDLDGHAPDDEAVAPLLPLARYARLDAGQLDPAVLGERCRHLHERGLQVVARRVDDYDAFHRCMMLPFAAIQGGYLLLPEKVDVPVLAANRLNVLRLLRALQEESAGPVELGQVIRNDAILSYKLLGCVNSAYFALPCRIKTVEQAAIFFGLSRMRNWIATLTLGGMSDRPPELLRTALIRAQMCEQLAQGMPQGQRDMAFTAGLFSLLDSLMSAPMDFVLGQLPLEPEISDALLHRRGPFAPLLDQVMRWEAGSMRSGDGVSPLRIRQLAAAYFKATVWADHVYTFAEQRPA